MKHLLCILTPAIFITLVYIFKKYLLEEKIKFKKLLGYYLGTSVILNILVIFIVYLKYDVFMWNYDITTSFFIKYTLLGNFFGLFLPTFYYYMRTLYKNFDKINQKYNIVKFEFYKENLKKYISDNPLKKYKFLFVVTCFALFFLMDFAIRHVSSLVSLFSSEFSIAPTIITLTFCFIFTVFIYYLPKKLSKILAIFLYSFNFLLFIAHYFMLQIKSEALSVYDLNNASEGVAFLNFLIDKINVKFVLVCIICIALMVFNFIYLSRIKKEKIVFTKVKAFRILVACVVGFMLGNIALKDYDSGSWQSITYERYYYNNFVNPKKSLTSLGLYEYTLRDIYLYFKEKNDTFGNVEKIESIISKYHTEYEENDYTGVFKGKNLIMIMLESIDYVVANEEAMPTFTYMMNNGWTFPNRYSTLATGGSTIATEYTSMTSLYYHSKYYEKMNSNYYPYSLPNQFNKLNYKTTSVHENHGIYYNRERLHKRFGFEESYFIYDKPESHEYYVDAQIPKSDIIYNTFVSKDEPFMSFIITIAAHGPYDSSNYHCNKNEKTSSEIECFNYLARRTDDMLKVLLERLKEDGLLDDTVIVMYTDHQAYSYNYTSSDLEKFTQIDEKRKIKSIPFVIYNPNLEHEKFDMLVNDIDLVPTILNLFGIKYNPDNYIGIDLFSKNHKNLILFDDYRWYDGNIYSEGDVDKNTDYYKETSQYVMDKVNLSDMILSNNYYETQEDKDEVK